MALTNGWPLDGTGEDTVGSADLTVSGTGTTYVTGHDGQGLQVDAASVSDGGATQVLTNPTAAASLTGWVRPNTSNTDREYPLLGFWSGPDSDPNGSSQFAIWASRTAFGTPSVLQANLRVAGTLRALNAGAMLSQAWHHVALTFDGTTGKLYVDGSEVASGSWSGSLGVGSLAIGRGSVAINDLTHLYDHALSAGEVTADMNGGGTDHAVSGTVAVVSGTSGTVTANLAVAGSVAAVSGASGAVTAGLAVSGAVEAVSGASGTVTANLAVGGTVSVQSALTGAVTANLAVSGTVTALSTVGGTVTGGQDAEIPELTVGSPVPNPFQAGSPRANAFAVGAPRRAAS